MDFSKIKNENAESINVVIEIAQDSAPVKYEYDKEIGALVVDRFMPGAMFYPCNYGFLPNSLSGDGDPLDVLVYTNYPIVNGAIVKVKPVGVLITEDESGMDEKILAVPVAKTSAFFKDINDIADLPEILLHRIKNFFEHYKSLESNKWVKVKGWEGRKKAIEVVEESIKRFED